MTTAERRVPLDMADLDRRAFAGLACVEHGVVVYDDRSSWGAHETGGITIPSAHGNQWLSIAYDEREAPYAVDEAGRERHELHLSLADEDECAACVWARATDGSPICGVGIDLCTREHFVERFTKRGRDLSLLLFTESERALAGELCPDDPAMAKALLFSAKEAAFKATAHALRKWYERHDDELLYEVRHFVMEELGSERGTGRNGAAQRAMDRMGIGRIALHHARYGSMAVTVAVALAASGR